MELGRATSWNQAKKAVDPASTGKARSRRPVSTPPHGGAPRAVERSGAQHLCRLDSGKRNN